MRNFKITVDGKQYNVGVEELGAGVAPAPVHAAPAQAPAAPKPAAPAAAAKGSPLTAPMPGTILDIRVNVGDSVKAGQVVMVLEAMKMENDMVAPCDGRVAAIAINKGDSVEANQLLATIA